MSSKPPDTSGGGARPIDAPRKKTYERPAFVREQVFETMALACGKTNPTSGPCKANRKNS
jgi:hypothetical protein